MSVNLLMLKSPEKHIKKYKAILTFTLVHWKFLNYQTLLPEQ